MRIKEPIKHLYSVQGGRRGDPPTNFSKRGGLAGSQFLEGGCWERGG